MIVWDLKFPVTLSVIWARISQYSQSLQAYLWLMNSFSWKCATGEANLRLHNMGSQVPCLFQFYCSWNGSMPHQKRLNWQPGLSFIHKCAGRAGKSENWQYEISSALFSGTWFNQNWWKICPHAFNWQPINSFNPKWAIGRRESESWQYGISSTLFYLHIYRPIWLNALPKLFNWQPIKSSNPKYTVGRGKSENWNMRSQVPGPFSLDLSQHGLTLCPTCFF